MMTYLFDTNILLIILRQRIDRNDIDKELDLFNGINKLIISVVTLGEIHSISKRNNWGNKRILELERLLSEFVIADINYDEIIDAYAEIDAFSQGKLKDRPLKMTSRNMGKNDLWIAATAHVLDAKLLTTDHDFDHLHNSFLDLICIER